MEEPWSQVNLDWGKLHEDKLHSPWIVSYPVGHRGGYDGPNEDAEALSRILFVLVHRISNGVIPTIMRAQSMWKGVINLQRIIAWDEKQHLSIDSDAADTQFVTRCINFAGTPDDKVIIDRLAYILHFLKESAKDSEDDKHQLLTKKMGA